MKIQDINDCSFLLEGEHPELKKQFRKLGGQHNRFARLNGRIVGGWVFPMKVKQNVLKIVYENTGN